MDEHWIGILQYMETWLSLLTAIFSAVSLLIVWKGYLLAKDYLGQHRGKVKEEKRIELIYSTKLKLSEIRFKYEELYSIPYEVRMAIKANPEKYPELIGEFMNFQIPKNKSEEYLLNKLRVEVATNLSLLKLEELQKQAISVFTGFENLALFHRSYLIKEENESKPHLDVDFFNSVALHLYADIPSLRDARLKYKNIQVELSNLYWK